ncbi:MAG: PEGA domain-containing protein [Gemmatimonadetes bacterium]|nr:PEGA domain-containing protein [Gemmatimonadota bacterium]
MLVGGALVLAWVWMAGGTTHIIQIDYRWGGSFLEGAEVEIDGLVVGTLQPYGRSNPVTGFEVEAGEHVVRVLREGCELTPRTVTIGGGDGRLATFMAEVEDGYECRVLLR